MNYKSHLAVGMASGLMLFGYSKTLPVFAFPNAGIIAPVGCIIGSVLPDIESPTSKIGRKLKPLSTIIYMLSKPFGKTGENHRGIFHDLGLAILLCFASYFYFPELFGFWIGVLTHLVLDSMNPSGVPFFFFKKIHLLPYGVNVYSGSESGTAISFLFAALITGGYILLFRI